MLLHVHVQCTMGDHLVNDYLSIKLHGGLNTWVTPVFLKMEVEMKHFFDYHMNIHVTIIDDDES